MAAAFQPEIAIRELQSIADLESALRLEREIWEPSDLDATPLTLAIATRAAGALWLGYFEGDSMIGFAFALPSWEQGRSGLHSHMLGVLAGRCGHGVGYQLKLAQRRRALAQGIREMTWTFDPLRSRNAHLNFCKLGVISNDYRIDFYGPQTSSPLHSNGTDRLWVTWHMADSRVEQRIKGKDPRPEVLDAVAHLEPLVRFNGDGRPVQSDVQQALSRQRVAIEIPGDVERLERDEQELARAWRVATREAFTSALGAGFFVKDFCRSIRGQQGPGVYLLERNDSTVRQ
jgi:predicted GNAT superfamily acetyltransferase